MGPSRHDGRSEKAKEKPMSEFVYLFRSTEAEQVENMGTPERAQQSMEAWLAWIRGLEAKGHLKNPGQPLDRTGNVVARPKRVITDGPFVEAKDLVLGFIIVDARDLRHAVEIVGRAARCWRGGSVRYGRSPRCDPARRNPVLTRNVGQRRSPCDES